MRKTTTKTFGKSAKSMATTGRAARRPARGPDKAKVSRRFYVDGTGCEVKSSGGMVSCKVSMLLATYPDKSMFGLPEGRRVGRRAGSNEADSTRQDCVSRRDRGPGRCKKIIPTIKTKAGL